MSKPKRRELAEYIAKKTLDVKNYKTLVREVAAYLLDQNLTSDLGSLMRDIMQVRAEFGIIEAAAVSAHSLSIDVRNEIKDILNQRFPQAKQISVANKIDPSVVGGVRVETAGQQIDMTVRGKLAAFKRLTDEIKE
jgi:F0F1-type ATP synthase delta subunit